MEYWKPGADFAEFAEALRINTDQILAAKLVGGEQVTVLFTGEIDEYDLDYHEPLYGATLVRDEDGIFVIRSRGISPFTVGGLQDEIEKRMGSR